MALHFVKMHGLGNDHVVVDGAEFTHSVRSAEEAGASRSALVRRICDRRRGVGGDGLIVVGESVVSDVSARFFNADGSEAEMCGNGIRCVGKYAYERGLVCSVDVLVETVTGVRELCLNTDGDRVVSARVDMGIPQLPGSGAEELFSNGWNDLDATRVSMGNPHAVVFTGSSVEEIPLERVARIISSRRDLFPDGVNVEVAHVDNARGSISARVFERGCGETEACGSGACAIAVAYGLRYHSPHPDRPVRVCMPGGSLFIDWEGLGHPVFMTGPAERTFEGELEIRDILAANPWEV
jgi:diaminopimelate epimerase